MAVVGPRVVGRNERTEGSGRVTEIKD
jgi:hypothetical protein